MLLQTVQLQSTTSYCTVLLRATEYYSVLHSTTEYYSILQSTTPVPQNTSVLLPTSQYYSDQRNPAWGFPFDAPVLQSYLPQGLEVTGDRFEHCESTGFIRYIYIYPQKEGAGNIVRLRSMHTKKNRATQKVRVREMLNTLRRITYSHQKNGAPFEFSR